MAETCNHKRRASDQDDACPFADQAADHAVKKVFAILGVDVEDPASVEEFREDLRFGKKLRKRADYGVLAFIGLCAVGAAGALWAGIVKNITGH